MLLRPAARSLQRALCGVEAVPIRHKTSLVDHPLPVVGCGSNVVDVFFRLRSMPVGGTKGYFADPTKVVEDTVVGGVTLNHLSWATTLGVPTGLLALQGTDPHGQQIRAKLCELGVSTSHIDVSDQHATSLSHILLDTTGERAILMAPASTGTIDADIIKNKFSTAIGASKIVTSEISQVPLGGVLELLHRTPADGISMIDVDVPPSVAVGDAGLGTLQELYDCVTACDVLKPTLDAAEELLAVVASNGNTCDPVAAGIETLEGKDLDEVAERILVETRSSLVAVTDGARGCGLATVNPDGRVVSTITPGFEGVEQTDATGAGDAFFGGLIAGVYHFGMPSTREELARLGQIGGATGAACCEVLGALPVPSISPGRVTEFVPFVSDWLDQTPATGVQDDSGVAQESPCGVLESLELDANTVTSVLEAYRSNQTLINRAKALTNEIGDASHIYVTGLGKSGVVARRMAASLVSLGAPAYFVHASEWFHGDLGHISLPPSDNRALIIAFSHSGESAELARLGAICDQRDASFWCVLGNPDSALAADGRFVLAPISEPELLSKVPSRSIVAQEALVNAVLTQLAMQQGVTKARFIVNHPGGAIGKSN